MEFTFEEQEEQYKPLILKIMNNLHIYRDHESFYQIGLIALWEASSRFDPDKSKFITFAYATIRGRLMEHLTKETRF